MKAAAGLRTFMAIVVAISLFLATQPAAALPPPATNPAPAPKSTERPLREIGRIRVTTPLCKALVGDAVRAIDIETENDRRLAVAETTLQTVDLDSNQIVKHRGVQDITRQFVALRAAAVEGNGVLRDFRERAKAATTDEQRGNLKLFADSLDGALHRQKTLADDIGRLIAYLDAHEPIDKDAHDAMIFNALLLENDRRFPHTAFDVRDFGPLAGVPEPLSTTSKNAAAELAKRAEPIAADEDAAAARIDPAFAGC